MTFASDVERFTRKVEQRTRRIHNEVCDLAFGSIVEGSPITAAPGQPVDTGYLKGSWQNIILGPLQRLLATNAIYAPDIEEGTRNGRDLVLRSQVGGFRSVALTVASWRRLVAVAVANVVGTDV